MSATTWDGRRMEIVSFLSQQPTASAAVQEATAQANAWLDAHYPDARLWDTTTAIADGQIHGIWTGERRMEPQHCVNVVVTLTVDRVREVTP